MSALRRTFRFALLVTLCAGSPAHAATQPIDDGVVREAIELLTREIVARHDPTRHWEPPTAPAGETPQLGGRTALAALSLIAAGIPAQTPPLREAIAWLRDLEMDGTYAVAARAMLFARLADGDAPRLRDDLAWLHEAYSPFSGGWDYRRQPRSHRQDNSITPMAALAIWEGSRRGLPVDDTLWRGLADRLVQTQRADGGWTYDGAGPVRGSIVAGAVASLVLAREALFRDELARAAAPSAPRAAIDEAIARGVAWMHREFTPDANPGLNIHYFAYLFTVERLCLAIGAHRLGESDWFAAGAAELIRRVATRDDTGVLRLHQRLEGRSDREALRVEQLAFTLLFLSRGRIPIAITRVDDGTPITTLRPTAVPGLLEMLGEALETELAWVRRGLDESGPWPASPILLLSAAAVPAWLAGPHDAAALNPELTALRDAIGAGATLLVLTDGRPRGFQLVVEAMARAMFPGADWRELPADHALRNVVHPLAPTSMRILGHSNGIRELVVHVPDADWPGIFQARHASPPQAWHFMTNLWAIVNEIDRAPPRLSRAGERIEPSAGRSAIAPMLIVRTSHAGNADPEPAAWALLASRAAQHGREIRIRHAPPTELAALDPSTRLSVTVGLGSTRLDAATLDALAAFARRGGTLLLETAGGDGDFASVALQSIADRLEATTSPLRDYASLGLPEGGPIVARRGHVPGQQPRLHALTLDGRVCAVASDEDITHALLRRPWRGVRGFESDDAEQLVSTILRLCRDPERLDQPSVSGR